MDIYLDVWANLPNYMLITQHQVNNNTYTTDLYSDGLSRVDVIKVIVGECEKC